MAAASWSRPNRSPDPGGSVSGLWLAARRTRIRLRNDRVRDEASETAIAALWSLATVALKMGERLSMAAFYKGVGAGTHLIKFDLRLSGLAPRRIGAQFSVNSLMTHIGGATEHTPCISLTRSYGVARNYALTGQVVPTATSPGHVYEVEINAPPPGGIRVIDPVVELAGHYVDPLANITYHHDGDMNLLLGVVDPPNMGMQIHLQIRCITLPGSRGLRAQLTSQRNC